MSSDQTPPAPKKRSLLHKAMLRCVGIVAVLMIVLAVGLLSTVGRTVVAPDWVQSAISERIEAATPQLEVKFGQIEFTLDNNWVPQARVRDVAVRNLQGEEIVAFSEVGAKLALRPLAHGDIKPKSISISGVFATLLRDSDGNMSLRGGSTLSAPSKKAASLPALIEELDAAFELPELSALISAEIQALTLRYEDTQAGRVWVVDGGRVRL
ncbi:MAG: AsmA family protein, partial [Rhodobacteraceae bacterium]|nr:AsmA family protein [Paracoccaceae bacterium]